MKAIAALLNAGADPTNGTDTWRETPLHRAAEEGHTKAIASDRHGARGSGCPGTGLLIQNQHSVMAEPQRGASPEP